MPTNPRERLERLQSVAKVEFREGSIDLTFGKPMLFPGVETYEEMIGMLAGDAVWALRVCEAAIDCHEQKHLAEALGYAKGCCFDGMQQDLEALRAAIEDCDGSRGRREARADG